MEQQLLSQLYMQNDILYHQLLRRSRILITAQDEQIKMGIKRVEQDRLQLNLLESSIGKADSTTLMDSAFSIRASAAIAYACQLKHAFGMVDSLDRRIGCRPGLTTDPYSIQYILLENPVEAGKDAQVYLRIVQSEVHGHNPQYKGSGEVTLNPDGETAMMKIKTSESMIPEGQNEAFISYNTQAQLPKTDGSVEDIVLQGQVKIRRPCNSTPKKQP